MAGALAALKWCSTAWYRWTACLDLRMISDLPWLFQNVGRRKAFGPRRTLWSQGARTDRRRFPWFTCIAHPRLALLLHRHGVLHRWERTWAFSARLPGCWRWRWTNTQRGAWRIWEDGYRLARRWLRSRTNS